MSSVLDSVCGAGNGKFRRRGNARLMKTLTDAREAGQMTTTSDDIVEKLIKSVAGRR